MQSLISPFAPSRHPDDDRRMSKSRNPLFADEESVTSLTAIPFATD